MKYISIFSGVEAASVAWEPLGWEPVAFSEIDPFPCAVLAQRFPDVPNLGDISNVDWSEYHGTVDLVAGGSPCQSFSIAGKREGLAGASGLMFEYIRCVREVMPRYFVWENVPGALSSEGGAAFKQLLGEMDDLGYGLAWRVLDAQFFGVAQRRRRVFLVGSLDSQRAGEILFERESLRWDFKTGKRERERLTSDVERGAGGSVCLQGSMIGRAEKNGPQGSGINEDVAFTQNCTDRHAVCYSRTARPRFAGDAETYKDTGLANTLNVFDIGDIRGNEIVVEPAFTFLDRCGNNWKNGKGGCGILMQEDVASTLTTIFPQSVLQPIQPITQYGDLAGTLAARADSSPCADRGQNVVVQPITMSTGQANAEIDEGVAPTQTCNHEQTIVCVADTNTNSTIDNNMAGTLKVGGDPAYVVMSNHEADYEEDEE